MIWMETVTWICGILYVTLEVVEETWEEQVGLEVEVAVEVVVAMGVAVVGVAAVVEDAKSQQKEPVF